MKDEITYKKEFTGFKTTCKCGCVMESVYLIGSDESKYSTVDVIKSCNLHEELKKLRPILDKAKQIKQELKEKGCGKYPGAWNEFEN